MQKPVNLFSFPAFNHVRVGIWYKTSSARSILRKFDGIKQAYESGDFPSALDVTHAQVCEVFLPVKDDIDICYQVTDMMQGERWSPNGEAKHHIASLGLSHTSICEGDVIQVGDKFYALFESQFQDITGFVNLVNQDEDDERFA